MDNLGNPEKSRESLKLMIQKALEIKQHQRGTVFSDHYIHVILRWSLPGHSSNSPKWASRVVGPIDPDDISFSPNGTFFFVGDSSYNLYDYAGSIIGHESMLVTISGNGHHS